MFCPKCGSQLPDDATFCTVCGNRLTAENNNYGGSVNLNKSPVPAQPMVLVQNRSIPLYLILSIVTCGIFGLYWFVCLADDLNTASGHPEDTSGIMVLVFTIVTCGIYGLYWYYKAGTKVAEIQRRTTGYGDSNSGILYLIIALIGFGIVNYCIIQSELNKVSYK